ncbi:Phosphopantothenoylcysteine decarboxylase [Penicillium daleae]|uniref:Phosphopantothenoylcysteine decarboxylase n=1 Tax=Penicillium daleae TaxID=63821 RepID=A0AAD6G0B9_9EURO|nr:Phosphopantothenoylcysteine decarboxylase [Penicillium daleae]KAJ5439874.1 Phosphopantothenoylcysteine decarboxylase [Penicillium daleae]
MSRASSIAPAEAVAAAMDDGKKHLLLAASGSVATIKLPNIISALSNYQNLSIRVILTKSATHFLNGQSQEQPTVESLAALPHVDGIYQDKDELGESWTRGAGILHINLRKWAHILVIAPLSANTLAKIVNGMSDNLLTDTIRAWDTSGQLDGMKKRIVVFPAMNVAMWLHPVTAQQIRVLEEDWGVKDGGDENENGEGWFEVFTPIGKMLACGDIGIGGMREWTEVVSIIEERLALTT